MLVPQFEGEGLEGGVGNLGWHPLSLKEETLRYSSSKMVVTIAA